MAKLTQAQRRALQSALDSLEWTQNFIGDAQTVVGKVATADATLGYAPNNPTALAAGLYQAPGVVLITKEYGSPLCGLPAAIKTLRALLHPTTEAR